MTSPYGKGVWEQVRWSIHMSVMLLATSVGVYDGGPSTAHSIFKFQKFNNDCLFVWFGINVTFNLFQSYRDGVWMWQELNAHF